MKTINEEAINGRAFYQHLQAYLQTWSGALCYVYFEEMALENLNKSLVP
jgi:hypothetical protein